MSEFDDEHVAWEAQRALARSSFEFWRMFLALRGAAHEPIDDAACDRWLLLMRAISWTESRHGTGAGHEPARDPMQCGDHAWWQQLVGTSGSQDRFVGGPGAGNYWANELPAAVVPWGGLGFAGLGDPAAGHDDPGFTAAHSYFWAAPLLILKANKPAQGTAYECGDSTIEALIQGAVRYNGGDPAYEARLRDSLEVIACGAAALLHAVSTVTTGADYPDAYWVPAHESNFAASDRTSFDHVVIHITDGRERAEPIVQMWQQPKHGSSAHFVIGQDGTVFQSVRLHDIAWHAHAANRTSVGIEHCARTPRELSPTDPGLQPSDALYAASARLVAWLCRRAGLPATRVVIQGHAEIDPATTHADCPNGSGWDWKRYITTVESAYSAARIV